MACYEDYIFQEYIDGELDVSTCKELEEHLMDLGRCPMVCIRHTNQK